MKGPRNWTALKQKIGLPKRSEVDDGTVELVGTAILNIFESEIQMDGYFK